MSGHSKWSTIKRKKGAEDAKRGKIFTKLAKKIAVAVKQGGPDPDANSSLRLAILDAKSMSMPKDNIERAINKAAGLKDADVYSELTYEGYGPSGVAFLVEVLTDNKNRTVSDVRHAFSKNGGNLGESGSVSWMFKRLAVFLFDKNKHKEDDLMEHMFEAGAEDLSDSDDFFEITAPYQDFESIKNYFDENNLEYEEGSISMVPDNNVPIDNVDTATSILKLIDMLEELEDVQNVYYNFEFSKEVEDKLP